MSTDGEDAFLTGRLLQWALRPRQRPGQEQEYAELVERYLTRPSFRSMVREVARGLGIDVLDAGSHGLVLGPTPDSVFALSPQAFRPALTSAEDRLLDGLVQVAIATVVFPRARDLEEDPDLARPPVTIDEVEEQLRSLCTALQKATQEQPDPLTTHEGLQEAWRVYQSRLDAMETADNRKAPRTTRRIIEYALERLRDHGCFTQGRDEKRAWQPTRRYQVLVQELAATALFAEVRRALEAAALPGSIR